MQIILERYGKSWKPLKDDGNYFKKIDVYDETVEDKSELKNNDEKSSNMLK